MKRRYRLGRRAEAAATTRRRIVEATLHLHDEQGIVRTSIRDVASRAAVAPATVLQHFPRMDDLIRACGELSDAMAPMPTGAVLAGLTNRRERVRSFAAALFEWWERLGAGWDHLQVDRRALPRVDAWLLEVGRRHRQLAVAALGARAGDAEAELLTALTTNHAWRSMRESGMDPRTASAHVARLFARTTEGHH